MIDVGYRSSLSYLFARAFAINRSAKSYTSAGVSLSEPATCPAPTLSYTLMNAVIVGTPLSSVPEDTAMSQLGMPVMLFGSLCAL